MADEGLAACDVTAGSAERLGESAHEDVYVLGVDTKVVDDTTSVRAECTDGVSFVNEEVELSRIL